MYKYTIISMREKRIHGSGRAIEIVEERQQRVKGQIY